MDKFKKLTDFFSKLPGIGPRQATRLVLALVDWPKTELVELARSLVNLHSGPLFCSQCFNFSENIKCAICASAKRDQTQIAVVEKITDLQSMEKPGVYQGVYHVLGGAVNPAEGILPERLKIAELKSRVANLRKLTPDIEVILATNPNAAGETTALYLEEELKPFNIKITRLARGLAAGSSLEYADEVTLANALKHRK